MLLNIPRTGKKQKLSEKTCEYPECNEVYLGISKSKYCKKHRNQKYINILCDERNGRWRRRINYPDENIEIKDKIREKRECICGLEGCEETYIISITPDQDVYPKYCEKHRNAYQRKRFKNKE